MIFDTLENFSKYRNLFPDCEYLLSLITSIGADSSVGSFNSTSDRIRYSISSFKTTFEEKLFEMHRIETDIHIVLSGIECIETASLDGVIQATEYNVENDSSKLKADTDLRIVLKPGCFVAFLPGEAHKPGLAYLAETDVTKIVFKVKL